MKRSDAKKSLCRSRSGLLTGVCSGIADYFDVDAVVVRVAAILLTACSCGLMVVPYVVLAVVLPAPPKRAGVVDVDPISAESDRKQFFSDTCPSGVDISQDSSRAKASFPRPIDTHGAFVVLMLLILLCILFLITCSMLTPYVPGEGGSILGFAPGLLVALGIVVLVSAPKGLHLTTRVFLLVFCCEACVALLPFTLNLCPPEALASMSELSLFLWFVSAVCCMAVLVFGRGDLLGLVIIFTGFAMVVTASDIGVISWLDAASSYSQHKLTAPQFRQ